MSVLYQIGIMALLICVGFFGYRLKFITDEGKKCLSGIVVNLSNPALIFLSFQIEYSDEKLQGFLYAAFLAFISSIAVILLSTLVFRGKDKSKSSVEQTSAAYSNCGFLGIPLVQGVYGAEGVFYLAAYIVIFNLLIWTHGVVMIQGSFQPKQIFKALRTPSLLAVVLGIITLLLRITLPPFFADLFDYIGSLNTPLAMFVAGTIIAASSFGKVLKRPKSWLVTIFKLIVCPTIAIGIFLLLPRNELPMKVMVIANACPTATLCTLLALTYKKDAVYSAELFAMTTILSAATLPLTAMIAEFAL